MRTLYFDSWLLFYNVGYSLIFYYWFGNFTISIFILICSYFLLDKSLVSTDLSVQDYYPSSCFSTENQLQIPNSITPKILNLKYLENFLEESRNCPYMPGARPNSEQVMRRRKELVRWRVSQSWWSGESDGLTD